MQRQEIPNNTDEQVRFYLASTLAIVEEFEIEDDLLSEAFAQVFQAIAGKQIVMMQPQPVDLSMLRPPRHNG